MYYEEQLVAKEWLYRTTPQGKWLPRDTTWCCNHCDRNFMDDDYDVVAKHEEICLRNPEVLVKNRKERVLDLDIKDHTLTGGSILKLVDEKDGRIYISISQPGVNGRVEQGMYLTDDMELSLIGWLNYRDVVRGKAKLS